MKVPRLMGIETEYGFSMFPEIAGEPLIESGLHHHLVEIIGDSSPPQTNKTFDDGFLTNGGRLYIDMCPNDSPRLEYASAESDDPFWVTICHFAGDLVVGRLIEQYAKRTGKKFLTTRMNVDCFGNTWGCHENYLVPMRMFNESSVVSRNDFAFGSFLAVRQLLTGAGVIGTNFALSQRAETIKKSRIVPRSAIVR